MELLSLYGLFLAKILTLVAAVIAVVLVVSQTAQRKRGAVGQLKLTPLGSDYDDMKQTMTLEKLSPPARKAYVKTQKKRRKQQEKAARLQAKHGHLEARRPTLYVLDFKGSIGAEEVSSLREEVTAVLSVASQEDEVLLRLESPGGVVHGYGLAASQLQRLRDRGVRLTVAVDKVAASGGYMMACVADRIVSAPFAILGSIGVVAQIPNFHRLLKRNDIDIELHTAGDFKRTLTLFGENTEQGRAKFRADLDETHHLFKQFVQEMRPTLDVEAVATGEHWFGRQALEKGLVDSLSTSDDLLIAEMARFDVTAVRYVRRKKMVDRVTHSAANSLDRLLLRWWQRGEKPLL
ncbi:protease SohB [Pantoea sp. 1.19]|uniref:protease SohB n=1 Tax=Pantoea sp. 1.19 TaxID=1925589 RepID=UPI000948FB33|nr:protease SohB [Pantoea sp. 1.19]